MLEGKNLKFSYHRSGRTVLDRVSLTLNEGEILGLTAPSGRGKTTLCRLLAGYERPEEGEVLLDGGPLSAFRGYCPVQLILQHPEQAVNPRFRMKDILEEGGPVEQRVLSGLGIEEGWLGRFPSELSGGELQRFCIARALGKGTRFLLCDESTAMLDLITQSQLWGFLVQEAAARRLGLLVVSHSEALLNRLCTRRVSLTETGIAALSQ